MTTQVPNFRRPRRLRLISAAVLTCAALLAGCAAPTYDPTEVPKAPGTSEPTAGGGGGGPAPECSNALASYEPEGSQPKPNKMPSGSTMDKIHDRGRLIAGVSADTYLLGSRNPISGTIEGFDIDMIKAISKAIFGDPNRYELKVITAADRIPALQEGTVDIVSRNMTITCDRWEEIAFSTEYYRSGQKILVRKGSKAKKITDLAGQKVCAPKATSSMENLIKEAPKAEPVGSDSHTGCLVLFQSGDVAAITGDDTVLAGLAAQDPYAEVPQQKAFTAEPYGIGVNKDNVDLVRFINATLEDMRKDGEWTKIYNTWLSEPLGKAPKPPAAVYGRPA